MAFELFNKQLEQFKINLDEDSVEYIGGMLNDMTLSDHEEVRESTETFLIDANTNDKTRNDFYKSLFSDKLFQSKAQVKETTGPILLNSTNGTETEDEKVGDCKI
jgi:ATP-binding cassette subfamily F protein 3